jgi:membrane protein
MVRTRIQPVIDWLKRVVTEPRTELTRWQRAVRFMIDLSHAGVRQLRTDQAPQMAGALAFRTLFSLLPVLVVATVLVKAMMGPDQFQTTLTDAAGWTAEQLGIQHFELEASDGTTELVQVELWLRDTIIVPAMKIEWRALGAIGVAVVIYAAIGLMVTIEKSFNAVLRAPEGRSWLWRITVYWTVLTVSPLAIAMLIAIDRWFDGMIKDLAGAEGTAGWQWLLGTSNVVWSFGAIWLFMTAVYKLVPNTTVRLRAALTGAFVAAILLEIGRRTMGAYIGRPLTVNLLYGSLGLIPLFMFWV